MIDIRIEVVETAPGAWSLVFHIGGPDDVIAFGPFPTEEAARTEAEFQRAAIEVALRRQGFRARGAKPVAGSLEWRAQILANAEDIYVRARVNGRWQSVPLASLTVDEQEDWLSQWAQEKRGSP